jgi:sugar phosphate isomerase/epimerase
MHDVYGESESLDHLHDPDPPGVRPCGGRHETAGAMIDRRVFLGALAGATAGLVLPRAVLGASADRIERIGLQLYTLRDLMKQDFDGTLAHVAEIGYREVEFAGYFDRTPAQVQDVLRRTGLAAPSAHVSYDALGDGWDATLHTARLIGHEYLVCAWIPEEQRRSLDDWHRVADRLNQAGTAAHAVGIQFAYHNHNFEFAPLDGRTPYDVLLAATDPQLVRLEMDLFWITYAGADPLAYFARYPGRFPLVHVKDMLPKPTPDVAPEGVMTDVGKGSIDWKRIFSHAGQAGIRHYFVEYDWPKAPLEDIRTSYTYLKQLTF